MNARIRYIQFFCFLFSCIAHAQTAWIDSARKVLSTQKEDTNKVWTLTSISAYYAFNDPDSGLLRGKQALALAEKLQYDKGIFWSIVSLDHSLFITGNYTLELDYAIRAYPIAKRLNDEYAIGWSNGMLCDSYLNLGDYNSAMPYIRTILKNMERYVPDELFSGYANMVPVYVGLHKYDSALICAKKGYELLKANPTLYNGNNLDSKYSKAQVYLFLGEAFEGKENYDSALLYGVTGFIFVLRTGKGGTLSPAMPWIAFKNMTDDDIKAIYAYLRTIPPAHHAVSNQKPFTHCAICDQDHGFGEKTNAKNPPV